MLQRIRGRHKEEKLYKLPDTGFRYELEWAELTGVIGFLNNGETKYLKVDPNGQVVEVGQEVRGKDDNVFIIGIPWLSVGKDDKIIEHHINFTLSLPVKSVELSVGGKLIIFLTDNFDYQELYDKVVKEGYKHIDTWLQELYLKAAKEDRAVQEAFQNYAEHERPVLFIEELSHALQKLPFSGKPLKNIESIASSVELNTVTVSLHAKYNGAR